ncbi:thermonuclease family protein [Sphingomonas sp. M1-B02]|uniref:thermonuclease family protein n=1 Tax=Sphingomonas sp. M1-B02 TaxID=3114300 RepID=UPI00224051E8|nr:thermonuclease family protein [Sphingomonas sp. S6-11]UZK64868.1 thermonuclease family protein [Sphingomonas sp. S6-11]
MRRSPSRSRQTSWRDLRTMLLGGICAGLAFAGWSVMREQPVAPAAVAADSRGEGETIRLGLCHGGGGTNCVVDGDTIWMAGERIRVADIDAPERHPPRCADEARLGEAATLRLQALLNAGPVTLETGARDADRYGRKLRILTRNGRSLGDQLVDEGLARAWEGRRRAWC